MNIFVLSLFLICLTLTQSTTATKKIEKRNADDKTKIDVSSKPEKPKSLNSKIDNSKLESPKVGSLTIDSSKVDASKVESSKTKTERSKEDQKHNLKLEDASDQKQVDREKKSCKTLTSQPSAPAKFCMEITGSPSTVTICDDDKVPFASGPLSDPGSRPQHSQGPQSSQPGYDNPQHSIYSTPQDYQPGYDQPQTLYDLLYPQSSNPLDVLIENGPHTTTHPSYLHVQPQSNQGYLPSVYQVSPQSPYAYSQNLHSQPHNFHQHPHLPHLHHHLHAGTGQNPNIYIVPGTQGGLGVSGYPGRPETYSIGGFQPGNSGGYPISGLYPGTPGYPINSYPGTPGSITIKGLPSSGSGGYPGSGLEGYPVSGSGGYPGSGTGSYPIGGPGGFHPATEGYYPLVTSCTCRQTPFLDSPNFVMNRILSPLKNNIGESSPGKIIIRPGSSPSLYSSNPFVTSNNPRTVDNLSNPHDQGLFQPSPLHSTLGNLGSHANLGSLGLGGLRGLGASANLGGLGGSVGLGNLRESTSPGNSDLGISAGIKAPGLEKSNSLSVRMGRPIGSADMFKQEPEGQISQPQRLTQTSDEPSQAMDVWGPVTSQGQRFSRGPDENTQEDHLNESQKHQQKQNSQMASQVQKTPEKHNIDDEIVRNFQIQSPAMQHFMMERVRQNLHHENNLAINGRYDEMDRISDRHGDA